MRNCEICGRPESLADVIKDSINDSYICGDCFREFFTQCDNCYEWVPDSKIIVDRRGKYLCYFCYLMKETDL